MVRYKLSDGTILLKSRFILLKVLNVTSKEGKPGRRLSSQIVNVIHPPPTLVGPPGGPGAVPDLQAHLVAPDLGVRPIIEQPSIYLVGGSRVPVA